ncbi:alpha/beta hydrolase [Flavobacterium sp.]|uniref:serine aminopeptidase domain-containing protein n=1 Tax=Flavobacterium sp. TaxID=239 RepID=UPI002622BE2D|nr:alpha/beta hydrolase [Flavobacterium sp.]
MKKSLLTLLFFITLYSQSQEKKFNTESVEIDSMIKGTLFTPKEITKKTKLVILIAGSGPTNRSGNQFGGVTNNLKFLSEDLITKNIAVFSFDKRVIAQIRKGITNDNSMTFDDMITDTENVVNYFKKNKKFKKIIIAGHSEGALIGMIVAKKTKADGFISLAGAGRPIYEVLEEQLLKQAPYFSKEIKQNIQNYKEGKTFEYKSKDATMMSIFKPSIQPYFISWSKWIPTVEIKKLQIPILIVNGTKDLQVPESDAHLLKDAFPKAKIEIIKNMNHLFKETPTEAENIKSYNDGTIPVMPILSEKMAEFINSI